MTGLAATWEIREGDALERLRDERGRFRKGTHWRERKPFWSAEWCHREYVERRRSTGEIAAEFGVTDAAILFWLRKHGIARRPVSEARAIKHWSLSGEANGMHGRSGALNPRFVDGSSPERQRVYASAGWRAVARLVRKRDGYRCVGCGAEKRGQRSLHLHHLKPWAGNPTLRLDPDNIVTLCASCHRAEHRRGVVL